MAPLSSVGAWFLYLCRSAKIPAILEEILRDFAVPTRILLSELEEISYVPPLEPSEDIKRITRQLGVAELEGIANTIIMSDGLGDSSIKVRACCVIMNPARQRGLTLGIERTTTTTGVTSVAIRNALKRSSQVSIC